MTQRFLLQSIEADWEAGQPLQFCKAYFFIDLLEIRELVV
jgi:hypothetical protein